LVDIPSTPEKKARKPRAPRVGVKRAHEEEGRVVKRAREEERRAPQVERRAPEVERRAPEVAKEPRSWRSRSR